MTVFVVQWLLHELHHLFHVAGFGSRCHFADPRHPIPVGRPGHRYYAGKMICRLYGTYGRMHPQVPHGR
jgi:hypothetical protein